MQNIWKYISNLGITEKDRLANHRTFVLSNQINFVVLSIMFLLFITTFLTLYLKHDVMSYGTLRVWILLILSFMNLVAARFGFIKLSKLSLIFLPPVVFLLGPTLIGYVEEESYTYYPYVIIASSIIPQLLLNPKKEKFLFWISIAYYLLLTIIIDKIMILFGKPDFPIIDTINTFYEFYKIAQVAIFLFINASIYYLQTLNFRFEEELRGKNDQLDLQYNELKVQKENIERQKDELVSKETETWQKLVSIISHEIMNSAIPITNLAGMTGQMLEDESGAVLNPDKIEKETVEDIHHGLKIIESRTKALISFVKATKSISQIPKPNIRKVPVKGLLDRITLLYKAKFKEMSIEFEKQVVPEDLNIEADLELIEQVIINLIQNALEAMQETLSPKLSVIAFKNKSGQVQISVSDNGTGIREEVIGKIFLPYYTTKTNKSGIGLSLSQQIMLFHEGRLEVSSDENAGTTFTMIF